MAYGVRLRVWGDLASFNRPEMKVERVSYDIMTPSAARGILEAIYWKPEMRWVVDRIHVLTPIRRTQIRRNEIDAKIPMRGRSGVEAAMKAGAGRLGMAVDEHRQQRAALLLRDVSYGIQAHVDLDNLEGQLESMDLGRDITDLASEIEGLVEDEKVNEELDRLKQELGRAEQVVKQAEEASKSAGV